jgi:hypothetical protein
MTGPAKRECGKDHLSQDKSMNTNFFGPAMWQTKIKKYDDIIGYKFLTYML